MKVKLSFDDDDEGSEGVEDGDVEGEDVADGEEGAGVETVKGR